MSFFNSAQLCDAKQKEEKNHCTPPSQQFNFNRLRKADDLWQVIDDPELRDCMKESMGADLQKYFDATERAELPEIKGDDLYSLGFVPHLFTIRESFLDLNLRTRKICIAVLDCDKLQIYGADSKTDLPEPMILYIDDLKSRKSSDRPLNICYGSKTTHPLANNEKPEAKKPQHKGSV